VILFTHIDMPGAHYKKLHPRINKVKYVEVHRKRGSFYKEVMSPNQATVQGSIGTPSTSIANNLQDSGTLEGYENWSDIPMYNPPHTKVC
jgi:hypothetical protein